MSLEKLKTKQAQISFETMEFDQVFQENWKRVYRVVYRIIGDPAEAEDLALGTFLRLHQKPPSKKTNIKSWLYRVATNLALNALRSQGRRGIYETKAGLLALEGELNDDPSLAAELTEERRQVRQVLSKMRKRSAKILILRYSDFSYAEIAKAIGTSAASIGTLIARAEREFERRYRTLGYD